MALKLKGSTSGFVALDAPAVAGNNTLILPENTGSAQQLLGNDITAGVTTFTSVTVNRNGDLTVPGTISIGGTLTYEDVTSVDSVGIVTARSGVRINGGGLTIIGDTTGLNVASGISTFQGISLSGDTTGLKATGVSTFIDGTTIANSGVNANKISLPDSSDGSLNIGVGSDLKFNHDGTHSYITEVGGGDLYIQGSNIIVRDAGTLEKYIEMTQNGSVDLYHNGTKVFETLSGGAAVSTSNHGFAIGQGSLSGGNVRLDLHSATSGVGCLIRFANDHNGDAYIGLAGDTTGDLLIFGGQDKIQIKPQGSAAVELYHGDAKKFETASYGVSTDDLMNFNGTGDKILIGDNGKISLGGGGDLDIYHNGTHNYIDTLANKVHIRVADGENAIVAESNGAVELYFNGAKKLKTINEGIKLTELQVAPGGTETSSFVVFGGGGMVTNSVSYGHFYDRVTAGGNTTAVVFRNSGGTVGQIIFNNTATLYQTSSDYRLKENAVSISDGITRLKTLKPYRFNFKGESDIVDGFFAHEVTAVPEAISGTKDEVDSDNNPIYQGIDQSKLVPLLTAALQEAITEIESLKARLDAAGL